MSQLQFGPLTIDPNLRNAVYNDTVLHLTPKPFELPLDLAEHRDRVVPKSELTEALWPNITVDPTNLTQTIFLVRKTLREVDSRDWIETIPKTGYRFGRSASVPSDVGPEGDPIELPKVALIEATGVGRFRSRPFVGSAPGLAAILLLVGVTRAGWFNGRTARPLPEAVAPSPARAFCICKDGTIGTSERLLGSVERERPLRLPSRPIRAIRWPIQG